MKILYCDMDGVLVDFGKGAATLVNEFLEAYPTVESVPEKEVWRARQSVVNTKNYGSLLRRLESLGKTAVTAADLEKEEYQNNSNIIGEARFLMKELVLDAGRGWWANLPWMPGGKTLWKGLKKYNPTILSAPMSGAEGCKEGKLAWITKNIGEVEVILDDEKYHYADGNVLVDDFQSNTVPWKEHGGSPVLHVAPKASKSLDEVASLLS